MDQSLPNSEGGDDGIRPWSDLPDLALHMIAMQLSGPFAYSAFARVCRSWRSAAKEAKEDFMATQPPLLIILPPSPSEPTIFYSMIENSFYKTAHPTVYRRFCYLGQSYGYIITLDKYSQRIPSLLNPLTSERIDFPVAHSPLEFVSGLLSAPPSSTNCMLILFTDKTIHYCEIGGSKWTEFHFPRYITHAIVYEGRLYAATSWGRVVAMKIGPPPRLVQLIDLPDFIFRPIFPMLAESDGELLMISIINLEYRMLEAYRLDLSSGEGGRWIEGLGDWTVFVDSNWKKCSAYCRRRIKGVEENNVYPASTSVFENSLYYVDPMYRILEGGESVWVSPSHY